MTADTEPLRCLDDQAGDDFEMAVVGDNAAPIFERGRGNPDVVGWKRRSLLLTAVENGGAGRSKMVALGGVDLP